MGAQVTDNIGLVERLMTTSIGAAMVGGKRIADAESARPCTGIGVCTISTRSDADQHTLGLFRSQVNIFETFSVPANFC